MLTKKNIRKIYVLALCVLSVGLYAQTIPVYKINNLLQRIHNTSDTIYVVNFWATWCKPCVMELPEFDRFSQEYSQEKIKVLLVSMDFKEDMTKKLLPFLEKHSLKAEVVLLDEIDGNVFINKISEQWSGAIPATLFTYKNKLQTQFVEKKLNYNQLLETVNGIRAK